ncbi:MAG: RHS repeat-associated core domain-containing protein [Thiothrix sp.]|nr:MAG: RHS repeat-associated core domain-containing protein [Thiothrix sp.]
MIGADGRKLETLSFTAWGERRAADWNPSGIATPALDLVRNYGLTQCFTGHEADEPWGMINMKGRLYDPIVGRFISADPFIQFADNTQSYNRYTYVLNNPLSFTDPSGYFLSGVAHFLNKHLRTIIAIGFGIVTGGLANAFIGSIYGAAAGAVAGGAVGAFTSTLIASGSVEAAFRAGVFGALSGGLAHSVGHGALGQLAGKLGTAGSYIAHGVAQGVVSVLQGGKFGQGFASGFFGHLAGGIRAFGVPGTGSFSAMMGRTMVAAVVGGTISQITGGKFANGAMTAAFVHLFNAEGKRLSKGEAKRAANALDEREGYWAGVKEGLVSIGKGLSKSIAYASSYWASKACSAWSSECAATHQLIRDEGGNIGLAAYDLAHSNWADMDNASMIISESTTAGGYIGSRVIGVMGLSSATTSVLTALGGSSAGIGVGIAGVVLGGNMLSASEMYGSNLSGSQLMNSTILYGQ